MTDTKPNGALTPHFMPTDDTQNGFFGPSPVCVKPIGAESHPGIAEDLAAWHNLNPRQYFIRRAVALTIAKKNKGRQRETLAILHLANDMVHFLSVTHCSTELAPLFESIGHSLISSTTRPESTHTLDAHAADRMDWNLSLIDKNPRRPEAWQLERWRMQHTCELVQRYPQLSPSEISSIAIRDFSAVSSALEAEADQFLASLDQDNLSVVIGADVFSCCRYNYLAHPDPVIRRNRRQAMVIFPLLVGEILLVTEPTPTTTRMGQVIDGGQKIIDWIAETFHVRLASVRALRHLSEKEIGKSWRGKLQSLLFLLSALPPERYPKTPAQWKSFAEAVQFIKTTTQHPIGAASTGMLLGDIARRSWQLNKNLNIDLRERARCIDGFIKDLGSALAAYIQVERLGIDGRPGAQAQVVASRALLSIGLRRAESLATQWLTFRRQSTLCLAAGSTAHSFPVLLPSPLCHGGLTIVQLTSQANLTSEAARLGHCVESYGAECRHGSSIIFSVRDAHGQPRSTFECSLATVSLAIFDIKLIQHTALHNSTPSYDDQAAVSGFLQFMRGPEALPLLRSFFKEKLLARLEPSLARDYRNASLMISFLAKATLERIRFEDLVADVIRNDSPL